MEDLGWVATGNDVNQAVEKLEPCTAEHMECASRCDLQFHTAKTEAALSTWRRGNNKHLRPKLTANINVGNSLVQFNTEAT